MREPWVWIVAGYAAMSVVTFVVYWLDKRFARKNSWRIPERRLHLLELLGGWPGAFTAQQLFRHKRRKLSFVVVTWLIGATHIAIWAWWYVATR